MVSFLRTTLASPQYDSELDLDILTDVPLTTFKISSYHLGVFTGTTQNKFWYRVLRKSGRKCCLLSRLSLLHNTSAGEKVMYRTGTTFKNMQTLSKMN